MHTKHSSSGLASVSASCSLSVADAWEGERGYFASSHGYVALYTGADEQGSAPGEGLHLMANRKQRRNIDRKGPQQGIAPEAYPQ